MKYYIIDTKTNNTIIATVVAKNEMEARKYTSSHFLSEVLKGGVVVASKNRYEKFYKTNP